MKKIFIIFLLFINFLYASIIEDKIKNIVGNDTFLLHNNLINSIIKKNNFIINGKIFYPKLLKSLNDNGLLRLRFNKPLDINITFKVNNKPLKSMKILKDTLNSLGYAYYFTKSFNSTSKNFIWKIYFKSEYVIDPYGFNKELNSINAFIEDINLTTPTNWCYTINFNNSHLFDFIPIELNEKIKLSKPLKPYMLKIVNGKKLTIRSHNLNHWFPKITFYDKDLNILGEIKKDRYYKGLLVNIPKNSYYVNIDDRYTLLNIKRGLSIILR